MHIEHSFTRHTLRAFSGLVAMILLGGTCNIGNTDPAAAAPLPLIPLPASVQMDGQLTFTMSRSIYIRTDPSFLAEAEELQTRLKAGINANVILVDRNSDVPIPAHATPITFEKIPFPAGVHQDSSDEAYEISLGTHSAPEQRRGIRIQTAEPAGAFYAVQTLMQTLAASPSVLGGRLVRVAHIADFPRFRWRGSMLDCSRHFISVEYIAQHLRRMAAYKLNVFHWHLSDDQGWRLPVAGLPKLTTIGAWRRSAEPGGPSNKYGGFYTAEEIQKIVLLAKRLHITVVPEIDMPGHTSAAIAAYPGLACSTAQAWKPIAPLSEWGVFSVLLCPGKESTFTFIATVLDALDTLFPGSWVHFGADEVQDLSAWEKCPDCQKKIRDLGLRDTSQLQKYFVGRVEQKIRARGKIPVAWSDAEPSLSETGTVLQFWSRYRHLAEGRERGFQFLLSPADYTYLDMNQQDTEPKLWAGHISLSKAYSIDPSLWNLEDREVLGIEAPLWTEYTPSELSMEKHLWPRLAAIAEAAWTPRNRRSLPDFLLRMSFVSTFPELPKLSPPAAPKDRIQF